MLVRTIYMRCTTLKGLRREGFAVLGQFCVKKHNVLPLHIHNCETIRKISNEFYQGELTKIIILVIFEDMASKREKSGPIFSSFHPLPSVAIDGRKQFQCRKIVFKAGFHWRRSWSRSRSRKRF